MLPRERGSFIADEDRWQNRPRGAAIEIGMNASSKSTDGQRPSRQVGEERQEAPSATTTSRELRVRIGFAKEDSIGGDPPAGMLRWSVPFWHATGPDSPTKAGAKPDEERGVNGNQNPEERCVPIAADRLHSLSLTAQWIERSINPSTGGSAGFYSRLYRPLKGWSAPYPETTGYLIPSLLRLRRLHPGFDRFRDYARRMADWICGLQFEDGGLPGGLFNPGKATPSIFNTAQMVKGLAAVWQETGDRKCHQAMERALDWLCASQEPDGSWQKFAYAPGFFPSYYTRVAWPILIGHQVTGKDAYASAARRTLDHILARQQSNGYVRDCGFAPGGYAFLHTVVYTIRGFLESGLILGDDRYWQAGERFAHALLTRFEETQSLAGAYDAEFREESSYACLTGNAQMAIAWMRIYQRNRDPRYLTAASRAIDLVAAKQVKRSLDRNRVGAIAGSSPVGGRYAAHRYPNWAAKFFMDALLLEASLLAERSTPPTSNVAREPGSIGAAQSLAGSTAPSVGVGEAVT